MKNSKNNVAYARDHLKSLIPLFDKQLTEIWETEKNNLNLHSEKLQGIVATLLDHSQEHNLRKAKRIRAGFIYEGYKLLKRGEELTKTEEKRLIYAACSIEIIHTGILMLDDFMDKDEVRRGGPTTHKFFEQFHFDSRFTSLDRGHYGVSMAVGGGVAVMLMGYDILLKSDFPENLKIRALQLLFPGIVETFYGQTFDLSMEAGLPAVEQDVYDLHLGKTSIYTYRNPLQIGAILAGATSEDLEVLSEYANPGGIAFQIQDDILGLFGDSEKTGKSDFADIREGKRTLLVLKAIENANKDQLARILAILGFKFMDGNDAEEFRKIVIDTGSLKYSYAKALEYARKSQKAIPQMVKKGWTQSSINFLDGIAEYMAGKREQ